MTCTVCGEPHKAVNRDLPTLPAQSWPERARTRYRLGRQVGHIARAGVIQNMFDGCDEERGRRCLLLTFSPGLPLQSRRLTRAASRLDELLSLGTDVLATPHDWFTMPDGDNVQLVIVFDQLDAPTLAETLGRGDRVELVIARRAVERLLMGVEELHGIGVAGRCGSRSIVLEGGDLAMPRMIDVCRGDIFEERHALTDVERSNDIRAVIEIFRRLLQPDGSTDYDLIHHRPDLPKWVDDVLHRAALPFPRGYRTIEEAKRDFRVEFDTAPPVGIRPIDDLESWDRASHAEQDAEADDIARMMPQLVPIGAATHVADGESHRVHEFLHQPSGVLMALVPGCARRRIGPFLIGRFPVTAGEYGARMRDPPQPSIGERLPAHGISFLDARQWCEATGLTLPRECEWEHAGRAGRAAGSWRADRWIAPRFWAKENAEGISHPVGHWSPNALGMHDVSGNVWEWCLDACTESGKERRILKGGSARDGAAACAPGDRASADPEYRLPSVGFRAVLAVRTKNLEPECAESSVAGD